MVVLFLCAVLLFCFLSLLPHPRLLLYFLHPPPPTHTHTPPSTHVQSSLNITHMHDDLWLWSCWQMFRHRRVLRLWVIELRSYITWNYPNKGSWRSNDVTWTQQGPESPTVILTWHASKYMVHKLHPRYFLQCDAVWGCSVGGVDVPWQHLLSAVRAFVVV